MEAFEKWADKEDPRPYGSEEWARERGWRSAMKKILKMKEDRLSSSEIFDYIEKELGSEK